MSTEKRNLESFPNHLDIDLGIFVSRKMLQPCVKQRGYISERKSKGKREKQIKNVRKNKARKKEKEEEK